MVQSKIREWHLPEPSFSTTVNWRGYWFYTSQPPRLFDWAVLADAPCLSQSLQPRRSNFTYKRIEDDRRVSLTNTLVGCRISLSYLFWGVLLKHVETVDVSASSTSSWSTAKGEAAALLSTPVLSAHSLRESFPNLGKARPKIRMLELGWTWEPGSLEMWLSPEIHSYPNYMAIELLIIDYFFPAKCRSRTWGALFFGGHGYLPIPVELQSHPLDTRYPGPLVSSSVYSLTWGTYGGIQYLGDVVIWIISSIYIYIVSMCTAGCKPVLLKPRIEITTEYLPVN